MNHDLLNKYIDPTEENQILILCGISHKTSTVIEREKLQIPKNDLNRAMDIMKKIEGVEESLILSTCNRIEFYLVNDKNSDIFDIMKTFYCEFNGLNNVEFTNLFYIRHGSSVARHLFRVVCGLDSIVLGEYQIQGQLKDAYSLACNAHCAGKILHRLFHSAFRVGKYIRTETSIGKTKQSIAGVASSLLKDKLSKDDRVAFIGVNDNIRIIAETMKDSGFYNFVFLNRTISKAERYSSLYGGEGKGLIHLQENLKNANAIVSCTGAPGYILTSQNLENINQSSKLKIVVDLGMPRDIELTEQFKKNFTTVNLENVQDILQYNENNIEEDLKKINEYFEEQVMIFQAWFNSRNDALSGFWAEQIEQIRLQVLNQYIREFPDMKRDSIDKFSRNLSVNIQNHIYQMVNKEIRTKS